MDAEEFLATQPPSPRKKRQFLSRYGRDIDKLHQGGCSAGQIVDWLALQGVAVSKSTVERFLRDQAAGKHPVPTGPEAAPLRSDASPGAGSRQEGAAGLSGKAAWDAKADHYITQDNPLIKKRE